jgi:superfamily I DNA/RNA helicase
MTAELRIGPNDWDRAIALTDGPQIVVAGPGTGKTEFLVRRATHLIESGRALAGEVLLLSFSRRTAADLTSRAADAGRPIPGIATFHAFARRLLETYDRATLDPLPVLLTGPEQVGLVRELLGAERPEDWPVSLRGVLRSSTLAGDVADFILRCQERLIDEKRLAQMAHDRPRWAALPGFMARYQHALIERQRVDYAALLVRATTLLEAEQLQSQVGRQFPYVLVDEYQDTSPAQARLLELLTNEHRNLTVTGDPYQSIYSFRGAELRNVFDFPQRFRDKQGNPAQRITLTTSFRVPGEILAGAERIVSGGDLPGRAGTVEPAPHRGRVEAHVFDQASGEADWIASEVERVNLEERIPFRRIGVLVRSSRHLLPELSRALDRRRIPHRRPDRRLIDHPAVRVVFDLATAARADEMARNPANGPGWVDEADRSMRRLLLGPLLETPLGQERDLLRTRRRTRRPWSEILAEGHVGSAELHELLSETSWCRDLPAINGFWRAWTALPEFVRYAIEPGFAEDRRALAEFAQVLDQQADRDRRVSLTSYERLANQEDFEAVPLLSLSPSRGDELILTTLHQAKGLEFDVIFIADAAEGVFPNLARSRALLHPEQLALDSESDALLRFRLQEEMRLAYTAMTRASARVVWTATSAAIDEGERRPSRFLLAAAGVDSFDDLGPPTTSEHPVTLTELQAQLRLTISDPGRPPADRLAAVAVLVETAADPLRLAGVAAPGPDTGVISTPLQMYPTSAQSYDLCPRRYVLESHLEASDGSSVHAHYGGLIHLVLEKTEHQAMAANYPHGTLEDAFSHLEQIWAEEADFGSPVLNEAWKRKAAKLLTRLYEDWPGGDAIGVRAETRVTTDIGDVRWSGRIDRIESTAPGQLRIVDYKTGTRVPTAPDAAESLQLGFYMLAVKTDPELAALGEPTEAQLWYPEKDMAIRSFRPINLGRVTAKLGEVAGSILNEDWTPRPGAHCETCTVRLVCPAWPEGREGFRV